MRMHDSHEAGGRATVGARAGRTGNPSGGRFCVFEIFDGESSRAPLAASAVEAILGRVLGQRQIEDALIAGRP
jgi:hypothetical protein